MGEQIVHPHNGELLGNKTKWAADVWNNMVKSQMHYFKWKKPDSKDYKPYNSIYMTFLKKAHL